jgi:PTH1 family peptidyl-tRNA hydrolase
VGLGNPGAQFAHTRHNAGADVAVVLADRFGVRLKAMKGQRAEVAEVRRAGAFLVLAVPLTYMNESGAAVGALVRRFGVADPTAVVVVHDELDLPAGRLQIKQGGGLAGHNGLKSIQAHLHSADFLRVRVGVGKPPSAERGADHVLSRPSRAERELLDIVEREAADAVETIVAEGVEVAMNRFNTTRQS